MFTVDRIKQWYKHCRTEMSRMKRAHINQKSGSAPAKVHGRSKEIWEMFVFCWDAIKTKTKGTETQVGICNHHTSDFLVIHAKFLFMCG